MSASNNNAITALVGTAFAGALAWFGTVTKMGFENKAQLLVLDERTESMEKQIIIMDGKLDVLIGGPRQQADRSDRRE
jgi:hypothetical protein